MGYKIATVEELDEKLAQNYRVMYIKNSNAWYVNNYDQLYFHIPAAIRDKRIKELEKILRAQKQKPPEVNIPVKSQPSTPPQIPEITALSTQLEPTVPLPPEEFIIHDHLFTVFETIATLEGLNQIENDDKHELPFAQPKGENKFSPKSSGEMMLSLNDVVIYFLIDIYNKYQACEDKLALLRLERASVELQNRQVEEAVNALDALLIERPRTHPMRIMEQTDMQMPIMIEA